MPDVPPHGPWSRLPILTRLIAVATIAAGLVSAAVLVSATLREAEYLRTDVESQVSSELATQLAAVADFVVVGDLATVESLLKSEVEHSSIERIFWRAAKGAGVDVAVRRDASRVPPWFVNWVGLAATQVSSPLVIGGRDYGSLTIVSSPAAGLERL